MTQSFVHNHVNAGYLMSHLMIVRGWILPLLGRGATRRSLVIAGAGAGAESVDEDLGWHAALVVNSQGVVDGVQVVVVEGVVALSGESLAEPATVK